jgi:cytoskeletal protein CcmA (bactofilin family)
MSADSKGKAGDKHTLVEAGSVFRGNLESSCPIVVLGKLEGEITGPAIEIREGGQISGRVKVKELSSRGELAGTIEAETVELAGRVQDQSVIRAQSLQVKLDAAGAGQEVLFGDCELSVGEELVKEAVINEAAASRRAAASAGERPAPPPLPEPRPPAAPAAEVATAAPSDGVPVTDPAGRRRRTTASTRIEIEPTAK